MSIEILISFLDLLIRFFLVKPIVCFLRYYIVSEIYSIITKISRWSTVGNDFFTSENELKPFVFPPILGIDLS